MQIKLVRGRGAWGEPGGGRTVVHSQSPASFCDGPRLPGGRSTLERWQCGAVEERLAVGIVGIVRRFGVALEPEVQVLGVVEWPDAWGTHET